MSETELKASMDDIFTQLASITANIQEKQEGIDKVKNELSKHDFTLYSEPI